jgi:ATPase subunit of ABC transporter with duplicated ATPase domains
MSINITLSTYDYLLEKNLLNEFIENNPEYILQSTINILINDLQKQNNISKINFINFYNSYIQFIQNYRINMEEEIIKIIFSMVKYIKHENDKLCDIIDITYNYFSNDEIYSYLFLIEIINNYNLFKNIIKPINRIIISLINKTEKNVCNNTFDIINQLIKYPNNTDILIMKIYVSNKSIDMINIAQLFLDVINYKLSSISVIYKLEHYKFKQLDKSSLLVMNSVLISGLGADADNINKITSTLLIKIIKALPNVNDLYDFVDNYLISISNRIDNIKDRITKIYYRKLNEFLLRIKGKVVQNTQFSLNNEKYINDIIYVFYRDRNYNFDDWNKYLSYFLTTDQIKNNIKNIQNNIDTIIGQDDIELTHFNLNITFGNIVLLDFSKKSLQLGNIYGIVGNNRCGKSSIFHKLEQNAIDNFFNINLIKVIMVNVSKYNDTITIGDELLLSENNKHLLDTFELNVNNRVNQLNFFMKYRFELLKAMLQNPDVIILDEPLINTDKKNAQWLSNLILNTEYMTWIITSNNYEFINNTCSHKYIIHDKKFSKCENINNSIIDSATMIYNFSNQINIKEEIPLITLENVSSSYLQNPLSISINIKSRIAILGNNGSGKTNIIKLLTGINKHISGNLFFNEVMSLGYISENIMDHLDEHLDKTPVDYMFWRYKKGYDKIRYDEDIVNITPDDFAKLRKPIIFGDQKRHINKLTGYRKLNSQNEFVYEISWLGLTQENNSYYTESQLVDMGMNTFIKNKINRFNRNKMINMNKLTPNYLFEYLNKWNIPSNDITIKNLSSSEKMRFILAATCWKNPDVLVLDEPTNHLDSTELRNLSNFIKSYHGGIVIATNNEQFARENMKIFLEIHNGIIHINN